MISRKKYSKFTCIPKLASNFRKYDEKYKDKEHHAAFEIKVLLKNI